MNYKKPIPLQAFSDRNKYCTLISYLTGISGDEIMSDSRGEREFIPRALLIWALIEVCGYSATNVGTLMGKRHATCLYARRRVNETYRKDKTINDICNYLSEYHTRQNIDY